MIVIPFDSIRLVISDRCLLQLAAYTHTRTFVRHIISNAFVSINVSTKVEIMYFAIVPNQINQSVICNNLSIGHIHVYAYAYAYAYDNHHHHHHLCEHRAICSYFSSLCRAQRITHRVKAKMNNNRKKEKKSPPIIKTNRITHTHTIEQGHDGQKKIQQYEIK